MKRLIISLLFLVALAVSCEKDTYQKGSGKQGFNSDDEYSERVAGREVIAYCTYYGSKVPDYRYVTQINYSFAELYVKDGQYKGFKLQGAYDKNTDPEIRFKQVLDVKKQHPEIKFCLSFSHTVSNYDNSQGGGFSVMASTDAGRKAFAQDCKNFINRWGIDGIDIDWEFPGLSWSGHACDIANDTRNFTLLMAQLRQTLGSDKILSYAGYVMDKKAVEGGYKYIDIASVDQYVDFVNIMTYDIASGKEGQHQSALDCPSSYWDCKRSVDAYLDAGVSASKLVLGIPFYARHAWDNSDGFKGCVDYKDFPTQFPSSGGFKTDNWDNVASVPYVTRNGQMWAGYDNPKSIGIKGKWIREKGMKGLMFWDYDADDSALTLTKATWEAVMSK